MNLITSAPAIHIYAREPHTRRKDDEARRTSDAVSVVMELRESPTYYPSDARLSQMSRLVSEGFLLCLLISKRLRAVL